MQGVGHCTCFCGTLCVRGAQRAPAALQTLRLQAIFLLCASKQKKQRGKKIVD